MADTLTTNRSYTKPEVGASPSTWGGKINTDLDQVDGDMQSVMDRATALEARATFDEATIAGNTAAIATGSANITALQAIAGKWCSAKQSVSIPDSSLYTINLANGPYVAVNAPGGSGAMYVAFNNIPADVAFVVLDVTNTGPNRIAVSFSPGFVATSDDRTALGALPIGRSFVHLLVPSSGNMLVLAVKADVS